MSNDNAFNGKLGVNMVLDSTPDTGPRVHAKENPRVSEMAKILRDHARHDYAECPPEASDFWAAADALEAKDKLVVDLLGKLTDMKSIIDQKHDSAEMVDGGELRYWSELLGFAIAQGKAKEQE